MNPVDPPGPLALPSQTIRSRPGLKVLVVLRCALTFPWTPEAWREVRQHIPWLLEDQSRIRKTGWFN